MIFISQKRGVRKGKKKEKKGKSSWTAPVESFQFREEKEKKPPIPRKD